MSKISELLLLSFILLGCIPEEPEVEELPMMDETELSGHTNTANRFVVDNIIELRTVSVPEGKRKEIQVRGYYEPEDGGGGTFYWDSTSSEPENSGTVFQAGSTDMGRWKRRYQDSIDVKWFGAVGDGVADDSHSIQNAFNEPVDVFFSPGNYIVSFPVISTHSHRRITAHANAQITLAEGSYTEMLIIKNSNDVVIENLILDGNAKGNMLDPGKFTSQGQNVGVGPHSSCLKVQDSENVSIDNIKVINAFIAPIVLYNSFNCKVINSTSLDHYREGIGIVGGQNCEISNCHGESVNSVRAWSLFWTAGLMGDNKEHHHVIKNNTAINAKAAFITINTTNTKVLENVVKKTVDSSFASGPGIRLGHITYGVEDQLSAKNSVVQGNIISGLKTIHPFGGDSGNRAISIDNGTGSVISKNIITDCNAGIGSTLKMDKTITIVENEIRDILYCAIYVDYGESSVIKGNVIEQCSEGIRSRQRAGKILDNKITGFSKFGIRVLYGASLKIEGHEIVGNNVIEGTTDAVSYFFDAQHTHYIFKNIGIE